VNDEALKKLLDLLDRPPPAASLANAQLGERVRCLYRRRQRRRRVVAVLATALVGVFIWRVASRPDDRRPNNPEDLARLADANPARASKELARLGDQIRREEQIVKRLLTVERRDQVAAAAENIEPGSSHEVRIDEQIGRASMAILLTADEIAKRPDLRESARHDYQLVIATFPNTPWVEAANQRLAAIQAKPH
jgi:hypothetical protein